MLCALDAVGLSPFCKHFHAKLQDLVYLKAMQKCVCVLHNLMPIAHIRGVVGI